MFFYLSGFLFRNKEVDSTPLCFLQRNLMSEPKPNICSACKGTQWTAKGLCHRCEHAPCTRASHSEATATREKFVANMVNRRPWSDPDCSIDMEHGDCPKCGSTFSWDFDTDDPCQACHTDPCACMYKAEPPPCFEPYSGLDAESMGEIDRLQLHALGGAA